MFCIIQPLFLEKLNLQIFIWDWILNLGCKGFWPSCVRRPWLDKSYAKKIKRVDSSFFWTEIICEDAFFLISRGKRRFQSQIQLVRNQKEML